MYVGECKIVVQDTDHSASSVSNVVTHSNKEVIVGKFIECNNGAESVLVEAPSFH